MTTALRVRPVPVVEPRPALRVLPDDEGSATWPLQEMLPLEVEERPLPGPQRPGEPGPKGWALQFTQVALEVVAGLRPPGQLLRWTSEEVQAGLQRRYALALRGGTQPRRSRVRSVHLASPVEGVAEVAAVVGDGVRCRAIAFRMEGRDERWQVTALDLG
jgi:Family of unknown function (DUF6459)